MLTAISKITDTWEKLEEFGDDTEFLIKPLNGIQQLKLRGIATKTIEYGVWNEEVCQFVCDCGLLNWRNLKDANGTAIEYNGNGIDCLPYEGITAITIHIISKSDMTGEDKKKSS